LADNPSSSDDYRVALELLTNFLREHEKKVDRAIDLLANIMEQMQPTKDLIDKIAGLEEKIDVLQKQIADITSALKHQRKV